MLKLDRGRLTVKTTPMFKRKLLLAAAFLFWAPSSFAGSMGNPGDWIFSGGMGLTINPTLALISPQAEYLVRQNITVGPLLQLGIGNGGILFAPSVAGRIIIGHNPRFKPSVEGGIGMAVASGDYNSAVGFLFHFGMGFDYVVDNGISLGTMIRADFAPPLQTVFLSWPVLVARFRI